MRGTRKDNVGDEKGVVMRALAKDDKGVDIVDIAALARHSNAIDS